MKSALVRNKETKNLRVIKSDDYKTIKDFAIDLRANNYRVLKIWNRSITNGRSRRLFL